MRITTHKIGDTFSRVRLYNLGAGTWSAVAPVYGPGGSLLLNLAVTLTALGSPDADGNTHSLVVLATATQTALWSETTLISEVVFTDSSPTPTIRSAEAYGIKTLRFADGTDSDDPAALIPGALLPALRGEQGISAYEVAVENGFVGSEAAWLASLVGPPGPAGVPLGGTTGQVLAKASNTDQDAVWSARAMPGANSDITSLSNLTFARFTDGSAETLAPGKIWYDATKGSWNAGMGGGNITQQIGEEFFAYGKASTAISDTVMTAVYRTGAVGASGVITFAPTVAGITDANLILGIATEPIALNAIGRVTTIGNVNNVDTSGVPYGEVWADDDTIWYNQTTGGLTNVMPLPPLLQISVGSVIRAHANTGIVDVKLSRQHISGDDIAAIINTAASKTPPVDADAFAGLDSAASYGLKKFTWANIKATLKTYFDTLYQPLAANLTSWAGIAPAAKQDALVSGTNIKTINSTSLLGSGDIAVSTVPGGSTTQVQFNDAGAFGGDSGLTFDSTTKKFSANGGTRTASGSTLTVSEMWNNAGVAFPGALVVDVTDTASANGSLLADFRVNGASRVAFEKQRQILLKGTGSTFSISWGYGDTLSFGNHITAPVIQLFGAGIYGRSSSCSIYLPASGQIGFGPTNDNAGTNDAILARDGPNIWAQRNGTAAQTARIYGTRTDGSNGRWLESSMSSAGVAVIKPTGNGTGASGNVLHISGLPTSNPGPGILWNNGGSVAIGT